MLLCSPEHPLLDPRSQTCSLPENFPASMPQSTQLLTGRRWVGGQEGRGGLPNRGQNELQARPVPHYGLSSGCSSRPHDRPPVAWSPHVQEPEVWRGIRQTRGTLHHPSSRYLTRSPYSRLSVSRCFSKNQIIKSEYQPQRGHQACGGLSMISKLEIFDN